MTRPQGSEKANSSLKILPPAYQPAEVGKRIYARWERQGCFAPKAHPPPADNSEVESGRRRFCITIPPPNVTGTLHMGHALQHAIHDALARWKRMQGFNTLVLPGMDHAGIATQMLVEKQLASEGLTREQLGREKFIERVWEWKRHYGGAILQQLRALGCSYDWRREVFTLDPGYSRAVLTAFVRLYEKGLVYRGRRVINWCPRCLTALSDLEVRSQEHDGHLWYIRYPTTDDKDSVVVATTRPETMLGDQAVAVHPEDERYRHLVACPELGRRGARVFLPLTDYALTDEARKAGRLGRELPVIADEAVDPEFGTGALKITPVHDALDLDIARRHGEPAAARPTGKETGVRPDPLGEPSGQPTEGDPDFPWGRVIGKDGKMTKAAGRYAGLDRFEARERIVQDLERQGFLVRVEPYQHAVGHCDRCGTVIEPLLSEQWFVQMSAEVRLPLADSGGKPPLGEAGAPVALPSRWDGQRHPRGTRGAQGLAQKAIEAIREEKVRYVPERFARLSIEWLEGIRDWCISRQLWWGHRIPAWKCTRCGEWTVSLEAPASCSKCPAPAEDLEQDPDVLDTWFSSALWPFAVLGWPEQTRELEYFYPTDLLITDRMILWLWVARMIFCGSEFLPDARDGGLPFYEVLVHPTILNPEGKRMSRTLGTGVDPMELIERYGPDATRFGLLSQCSASQDVRFSEERLEQSRNFCNKVWNAMRLALMNLPASGQVRRASVSEDPRALLADATLAERWILSRLDAAIERTTRALQEYRFDDAALAIHEFFWNEVCDWYLEMIKPSLRDPAEKQRASGLMLFVLSRCLKLLHPFMPFITEELWSFLPEAQRAGEPVLMLASWPQQMGLRDENCEKEMAVLQAAVAAIRRHKKEIGRASEEAVEVLITGVSDRLFSLLTENTPQIVGLPGVRAYSLTLGGEGDGAGWGPAGRLDACAEQHGVSLQELRGEVFALAPILRSAGVTVVVEPVTDEYLTAQQERLSKDMAKVEQELARVEAKLANPRFLERAPAAVVEKARKEAQELASRRDEIAARRRDLEGSR
jgi:valyl-tRNA synthetase